MEAWTSLISNLGFPIACCCAMAYILWSMWVQIKTTCDTLTKTNNKLTETNNELVKTNSNLVSTIHIKLDELKEDIREKLK